MLPQDFVYQLKLANPIEDVMSRYVQLNRSGTSMLKCRCPFHNDKTPSCCVYTDPSDAHFYCYGCHVGGDVITFIMMIENLSGIEAIRMLAERAGMTVPAGDNDDRKQKIRDRLMELNHAAAKFYYLQLNGKDQRGLQYLISRKILPETVKKFRLGYAGEGWDTLYQEMRGQGFTDNELLEANLCGRSEKTGKLYDKFRTRVIFPIFDLRGKIIAFGGRTILPDGSPKYLNSSDTEVFKKGKNLYAMQIARKTSSNRIILAEGYMDVITMHQAGFDFAVASLGTALTPDQCKLIQRCAEDVVISYDSDAAGQNATQKAINLIRQTGMKPKILRVTGAKDPDEFLKKYGPSQFRKLLNESIDAVTFELERCKDGEDIQTEDGKITALHRAVGVLAGIENELERSVYMARICREYDIPQTVLQEQIRMEQNRRKIGQKKQEKLASHALLPPPVAGRIGKTPRTKEVQAERMILCYLFRNPGETDRIAAQISPESFVTPLNQRIFEFVCEYFPKGMKYSPSLFADAFSLDEISEIVEITMQFENLPISENALGTSILLLRNRQDTVADVGIMNNDDFSEMFNHLCKDKTPDRFT